MWMDAWINERLGKWSDGWSVRRSTKKGSEIVREKERKIRKTERKKKERNEGRKEEKKKKEREEGGKGDRKKKI